MEITNTKHPKQLNTEGKKKQLGEKKKPLPMLQKWKNYRALPEEKTPFRKLSILFSNSLTVMTGRYE